jgi:hypothetical protein
LILVVYARVYSEGENGNGWVGGIMLNLVPSAIQLGCENSPVFKVENHMGKLVF